MLVITDLNRIHWDSSLSESLKPIRCILQQHQALRTYLPPSTPHFNPLNPLFAKVKSQLASKNIKTTSDLEEEMWKCALGMKDEPISPYFDQMK